MSKPVVLHVYKSFYPDTLGGIETVINILCTNHDKRLYDHKIFTLSSNGQGEEEYYGGISITRAKKIFSILSCDIGGFNAVRTFIRLSKSSDVLHIHFPWPYADFLVLITFFLKKKVVVTYHADVEQKGILGTIYSYISRVLLKLATIIIVTSENYAKTSKVLSNRHIKGKLKVIPIAVPDVKFPKKKNAQKQNKKWKFSNKPYFIFIGANRSYKGANLLYQAALRNGANVVFVGRGFKSNNFFYDATFKNVEILDEVSDSEKFELLRNSIGLILPSTNRAEAFGVVLAEALMMGCPIISTELGTGTSFVNLHNVTGLVIRPNDVASLQTAMERFLNDKEMQIRFARNARKRYLRLFKIDDFLKSHDELYQDILQIESKVSD